MKKLYTIGLFLIVSCSLNIHAQDLLFFFGYLGKQNDSVLYYFNDKKDESQILLPDQSGNYSLEIKTNKDSTISFYNPYKQYCTQVLNLNKIIKYSKEVKDYKICNDLSIAWGFACIRMECDMPDENRKFMGVWTGTKNMSLKLDCYYERSFSENGYNFIEEGYWEMNENQMELKSVYVKNTNIGTYIIEPRLLILNFEDDKLIFPDEGVEFIKKK